MIGEKPKVLTVHFTLRHGSNIKQITTNTNLGTVTFKSSEIFPQYVDPYLKKMLNLQLAPLGKSLRNLLHGMDDQSI